MGEARLILEHVRHHVLDDMADLISVISLVDPIVGIEIDASGIDTEIKPAFRFLRRILSRNIILILCRLHENPGHGRHGATASLPALITMARGQLCESSLTSFTERRRAAIESMESAGVKFQELYEFRTAEMAHSVHRHDIRSDNKLYYSTVAQFAHETIDLIMDVDNELVLSGLQQFTDMPYLKDHWKTVGATFWDRLKPGSS